MSSRRIVYAAVLAAAALLAGCANVREVRSTVRTYSTLAALPEPALYRLELLPSQRAVPAQFGAIEALAQQALAHAAGLQRDDANATLVVHIGVDARELRERADWPHGVYGTYGAPLWWGWPYSVRAWGWYGGWHGSFYDRAPLEYYRAVSIVMRDAATQSIVYETSAATRNVWNDDPAIFGVLFDAALSGFPKASEGPYEVTWGSEAAK